MAIKYCNNEKIYFRMAKKIEISMIDLACQT